MSVSRLLCRLASREVLRASMRSLVTSYNANPISFDGQVAIITGAGGALGQAYAFDLANRGCNLVLNDIGASITGENAGMSKSNVEKLADEIRVKGKVKVLVSTESAQEGSVIMQKALDAFGRCDILINNAGNLRDKSFSKMTLEDWQSVINVHLHGTFAMSHAVWPHMQTQQYGRIVNIGSGAGLYGNFGQANYSSAKMGILGMTQTLAKEGVKSNIQVNCVVPVAHSRMTETVLSPELLAELQPGHIAPLVTYLASQASQSSGMCYEVGGGWYSKIRIQRSRGISLGQGKQFTSAEEIGGRLEEISSFDEEVTYPTGPGDALQAILKSREDRKGSKKTDKARKQEVVNAKETHANANASSVVLQSDSIFDKLSEMLESDESRRQEVVTKIKAVVAIKVLDDDYKRAHKYWLLCFHPTTPIEIRALASAPSAQDSKVPPACVLSADDQTLTALLKGGLSPEYAYMRGKLEIDGHMGVAMKIKNLLDIAKII